MADKTPKAKGRDYPLAETPKMEAVSTAVSKNPMIMDKIDKVKARYRADSTLFQDALTFKAVGQDRTREKLRDADSIITANIKKYPKKK
tara:strand:- start:428 stop:694 length:267 start_codon:yes stop_codon:yes gene_type:complete